MIRARVFVPVLAGVVMLAILLRLGFWQLERAAYKEELGAISQANDSAPAEAPDRLLALGAVQRWRFRQARADGALQVRRQYLLDNRTHRGRAGYHVLALLPGTPAGILVNRGWVPVGPDRSKLPDLAVPESLAPLTGRLVPPPSPGVLLGPTGHDSASWPRVVQVVDLELMEQALGTDLLPAVLLLDPDQPACYVCDWSPVPGISAERHRGYALQWFALAAALVVIAVVVSVLAVRRRGR